jgi:hypothetical protein
VADEPDEAQDTVADETDEARDMVADEPDEAQDHQRSRWCTRSQLKPST